MPRTGRPKRDIDINTAKSQLDSGRSLRSVARELGLSFSTLQRRMSESSPDAREKTFGSDKSSPDTPEEHIMTFAEQFAKVVQESTKAALRDYLKTASPATRELYERPENRRYWE
jgi:DNA-binding transcriptional MocR family regulator